MKTRQSINDHVNIGQPEDFTSEYDGRQYRWHWDVQSCLYVIEVVS